MNRRRIFYLLIGCWLLPGISGCYYDNEEDLYGVEVCTTEPGTFTEVSSLITTHCLSCHNSSLSSGGVNLDGHTRVKAVADDGSLLGVITHSSGYSPMPQNAPRLGECDINAIRTWIDGGALDN